MTANIHGPSPPYESRVGSLLLWLILHGLAGLILLAVLLLVVPKFDRMFAEFGLKLPVVSVLAVNASRTLWRFWFAIVPAMVILDGGMLCLLTLTDGMPRWLRTLWCLGVLVILGCMSLLVVIAVVLPLVGLVEGLK
jgi:hypothetical protein